MTSTLLPKALPCTQLGGGSCAARIKLMWPLVSVFMPTYNHASVIEDAFSGVLAQDYPALEVVIPDDGSTDGTVELIERFARDHPALVRPLLATENVGMVHNFNRGLRACRGEYVVFTAGDDVLLAGKIRAQVEWLEQSDRRVLCGHDVEVFDDATGLVIGRYGDTFPLRRGFGASAIIEQGTLFSGTSVTVRRSALPPGGYDPSLRFLSDVKLQMGVLADGGEYGYVPGVLARYRRHADSVTARQGQTVGHTHQVVADWEAVTTWIRRNHSEYDAVARRRMADTYLAAAKTLVLLADRRAAGAYGARAVRSWPPSAARAAVVTAAAACPPALFRTGVSLKRKLVGERLPFGGVSSGPRGA